MNVESLFGSIRETAAPVFERELREDCCLNASRILLEVFHGIGVQARPISVRAFAYNGVYMERLFGGLNPMEDPRAWGVAVETRPGMGDPGGWPGHLVVLVESKWIIDGSSGQFARPEKGILVPNLFVGVWPKKGTAIYQLDEGGVLRYEQRKRDLSYQMMAGFRCHADNQRLATEILGKLNERGAA